MYKKKRTKIIIMRRRIVFILLLITIIGICLFQIFLKNNSQEEQGKEEKHIESVFPEDVFGVPVHTSLLDITSDGRPGIKRQIKYIVLHETGNEEKGTDAESHDVYLRENTDISTSWHYTVDDHEIYHHIPDDEIAWHAGDGRKQNGGNLNGIGIELCINSDGDFEKTFDNATRLVAYLLKAYGLSTKDIKQHADFIQKDCPYHIRQDNRIEEFIKKVEKLMKE